MELILYGSRGSFRIIRKRPFYKENNGRVRTALSCLQIYRIKFIRIYTLFKSSQPFFSWRDVIFYFEKRKKNWLDIYKYLSFPRQSKQLIGERVKTIDRYSLKSSFEGVRAPQSSKSPVFAEEKLSKRTLKTILENYLSETERGRERKKIWISRTEVALRKYRKGSLTSWFIDYKAILYLWDPNLFLSESKIDHFIFKFSEKNKTEMILNSPDVFIWLCPRPV